MPIPDFDSHGLLPVGVHECSPEEVQSRFGTFQESDRRPKLIGKLKELISEAKKSGFAVAILVDGSFVTAVADPNDIDLVLVLPKTFDVASDLRPADYNLVSRKRVQKRFGFDIVVVRENTEEFEAAVDFFTQVRNRPYLRKGILRISI
jgi:isocitrate/isopropylmalate dehydrogenase